MTQPQMIEVLSEIANSSHSGTGNSYYNSACPRKVKLDQEFPERFVAFELQVGLVFHKIMELWRTNALAAVALSDDDSAVFETDAVAEALRLFRAYASYYGDAYGRPKDFRTVAVEAPVADVVAWGVPFTMRTDAVVAPLPGCGELRGIPVEDGLYLLDYKTTSAKQSDQCIKDELSTQFKAYIHVWNSNHGPDMQVKGLIVDRIIRYKRDMMKPDSVTGRPKGLESSIVKAPTDREIAAITNYYQWKKSFLETSYCNLEVCAWPRICRHYTSGACDRISQ